MEIKGPVLRRVLPLAVTVGIGVSACASGSETAIETGEGSPVPVTAPENPVATDTTENQDEANEVVERDEVCPEGFTTDTPIAEEFSLKNVGGTNSVLPSFFENETVGSELVPAQEAASTIMDISCVGRTVLASIDALMLQTSGFNKQGDIRLPDDSLMPTIEERTELFRDNETEALRTLENLASVILADGGFEYTDSFNVIADQAVLLAPLRNEETGAAEQMTLLPVTTSGTFEGYKMVFNLDDPDLSSGQISTLKQLSELVLFNGNGEILIKSWIGDTGSTNFEVDVELPPTTTIGADPNTEEGDQANDDLEDADETEGNVPVAGNNDQAGPNQGSPDDNGCKIAENPGCEGGEEPGTPLPPPVVPPSTLPTSTTTTTTTTTITPPPPPPPTVPPTVPTTPPTVPTTPPTTEPKGTAPTTSLPPGW